MGGIVAATERIGVPLGVRRSFESIGSKLHAYELYTTPPYGIKLTIWIGM